MSRPSGTSLTARLLILPLVALVVLNSFGIAYYVSPLGSRVRHPLHSLLKPSGTIGQTLGLTALTLFLFMWLYPVRKKFRSLAWTGSTRGWLEVHIAAGLLVPLVAATHAGWRFTGLIGLGYGAMFLVCCSGIVGRYLYLKIPRAKSGLELSIEQMESEREGRLRELAAKTGLSESSIRRALTTEAPPEKKLGVFATFARLVRDDFQRRRAARAIVREWEGQGRAAGSSAGGRSAVRSVLAIARREIALSQQIRVLDSTHRVFAYWHAAHRPVAVTAFLAVAIHVTVAVVMGATWFR